MQVLTVDSCLEVAMEIDKRRLKFDALDYPTKPVDLKDLDRPSP